jgi:hypothetical protein
MFDLPRKVSEFSCLCCGERFWTTQGEASVFLDPDCGRHSHEAPEPAAPILEFHPTSAHRN